MADLLTGSNAVIAILAAVIARSATGRGQRLDVAMSDSSLALVANILSRHPDPAKPPPKGMARADSGIWQTADGRWLVTTDMEPAYWRRFCDAVGLPELADRQMDRAAWPEMKERIAARMAQRSLGDWLRILGEADTQFAPVHSVAEAMAEPHHLERGAIVDVPLPGGGTMAQPATPIRLSDTPAVPPTAAAPAGRDTADVLAELGLSDAEIAQIMEESR